MKIKRRELMSLSLAIAATSGLSACAGAEGEGSSPLVFGFWGNDLRTEAFGKVVDLFETANPEIAVRTETGTFDSYFERLAVQVAGGDEPDVISMDIAYFSEYAGRGALRNLEDCGISTEGFPESLVDSGRVGDELLGLAHGMAAGAMLANPTALDNAQVQLPDDTSWTWPDLVEVAIDIGKATEDLTGLGGRTFLQALGFQSYLAEREKRTFTREGEIGFTADDLTEWWELMVTAFSRGAMGSPEATVEEVTQDVDRSGLATGAIAIDVWWSNQLTAMNSASGEQMRLLRFPSFAGTRPPVVLQPTVYWTVSSRSAQPENAAALINFFTSTPEAAEIILTDRGLPGNETARAAIEDQLSDADRAAAAYAGADANEVFAPFPPPVGGSQLGDIYTRRATEVIFQQTSAASAAAATIDELAASLHHGV